MKMKKMMALVLSAAMVCSMSLAGTAFAEEETEETTDAAFVLEYTEEMQEQGYEALELDSIPYQKLLSGKSKEDEEVIEWAMRETGVLQFRDKSIYEISGGETQRVWIATVLAQKPEIMFLDEPTTYLDVAHQLDTMRLVKRLNRETGIGIVMVLHDLTQAMEISDHVIVICQGEKYDEGAPEDVITSKMMKEVYDVNCELLHIDGRKRPLLAYEQLAS